MMSQGVVLFGGRSGYGFSMVRISRSARMRAESG
jgi:hypothetical protein